MPSEEPFRADPQPMPPPGIRVAWWLVVAIGYAGAARLGYLFTIHPVSVSLWPASGLLLGILLLTRRQRWPELLVAAMVGNILADRMHHAPLLVALAGAAANAAESLIAALVVQRLAGRRLTLGSMREFAAIAIGAGVVSNALTAVLGAFVIARGVPADFWHDWFIWWAGDGLGILVVTPVLITWSTRETLSELSRKELLAFALLCTVVAGLAWFALGAGARFAPALGSGRYLVFPILFLAALRYGPWGASTASLLVGCIVAWKGAHADPAFVGPGMASLDQLREVYIFLLVASISAMVPAVEVSSRRRAEAQLRTSERRFQQMAQYIEDAFFVLEVATGTMLYVSPNWVRLWGRPIEEAYQPHRWLTTIHPEDQPILQSSQLRVLGGQADSVQVRVLRPDGSTIWIRSRAFPVRDAQGRIYRIVGVATDISAIRNAEERLILAQKMEALGRLAGGVAHDFNNMLTVILADTELLGSLVTDREGRESLTEIRKAAERAAGLTQQLLMFSRRQVVPATTFDLNDVMRDLGTMLRRVLGEHIVYHEKPAPIPCIVRADRGQIEQVITNLALNARDAMPDGGTLTLTTAIVTIDEAFIQSREEVRSGSYVMLSVTDTGVGMSDAVRSRVFEPFFTTKPPGKGTGLGLATSYGVVQKAGGHLTVYSEPGTGSTFRMYLPEIVEASPEARLVPGAAVADGWETVLLVEDEDGVRQVAARLLRALGYRVIEAESGAAALARVAEEVMPIELLLTDVMLPDIGGHEVSQRVRALRPGIKVLFMSGYTEDAILGHHLLEQGMQLLSKPFSRDELARAVRATLDGRR